MRSRRNQDDDYYYEDDDEQPRRRWGRIAGIAVVIAALVAAGAVWQLGGDGDSPSQFSATSGVDESVVGTGDAPSAVTTDQIGLPTTPTISLTDDSTNDGTNDGTDDTDDSTDVTVESQGPTPTTGETTDSAETTDTAETTDATDAVATTDATTGSDPGATGGGTTIAVAPVNPDLGYPTSPDGSPLPVLVIFDTTTITLTGQVPTEAAKDRLAALALANSQFPDAEVINQLLVNDRVPFNVGVRVIELNSARFPEGSAEILPDHAMELDRVVAIMKALPNVTVLVVGHADQRGDAGANFATSDERARAVVNYLRFLGIEPTRLSSRAAGESDLLTLADDETALALNRRTEFIFYGLIIE